MVAGASTPVTKPRLNMNGWNCSAASSSQTTPSPICRTRRAPADSGSAAHGRDGGQGVTECRLPEPSRR